ncbi:DUF6403 family protein [Actinoplanes sp. NPDC051494]|uniref:DUF6403 family protein n=1 Tax=Actinoplanes sp. NPDC051494 TaxID=3363907 RepID=UPI00378945AF
MGWIWAAGATILVLGGFTAVALPRMRAATEHRRNAWSTARAATATATISRDAARTTLPEADLLLARAEAITAAGQGGHRAAEQVTDLAGRADHLWRQAETGHPHHGPRPSTPDLDPGTQDHLHRGGPADRVDPDAEGGQ